MNISVLIPIYNVGNYIERCARSLMEQTIKDEIEFIFINDGSSDNSIEILEKIITNYKEREEQVKILHQPSNLGLSNARLRGILESTGTYIINCDSDDWVEPDMYESLWHKAKETNADIVVSDFYHEFADKQRIERYEEKSPHEAILSSKGNYWWCTCNRLVKKSLYEDNNIYPIPGINMLEDVCVMMRLYYYATKIEYVHRPLYHYDRTRESSMMHKKYTTQTILQRKQCVDFLATFFEKKNFKFDDIYNLYKINIRDSFLLQSPTNWEEWRKCYPETWKLVWKNHHSSFVYKLCYTIASWGFLYPYKKFLQLSK